MTRTIQPRSIQDAIGELARRLRTVEQTITVGKSNSVGSNPQFDSITIGDTLLNTESSPPNTLVLATGTFFDDVFIDASWNLPADGSAVAYDIDLAKKNADGTYQLDQSFRSGSNSIRISALQGNVTYGVRVTGVNRIGISSASLPAVGWTDIISAIDASVPPVVTDVILSRGATSAVVKFTPLTLAQAPDVANGKGLYEVELHSNSAFTNLLRSKYTNDQITAFTDLTGEQFVYARVRAIDATGNAGPWASSAAGTTVGGVVDSMIVAGLDICKDYCWLLER